MRETTENGSIGSRPGVPGRLILFLKSLEFVRDK